MDDFVLKYINNFQVHRIGRTGRAGAKGIAISFLNPDDDFRIIKELVEFMEESE